MEEVVLRFALVVVVVLLGAAPQTRLVGWSELVVVRKST